MRNVLLMNCGGGEVLNVISWQRAQKLLTKKKVQPLEHYDDVFVRTTRFSDPLPAVLSLLEYVVIPFEKRVKLNRKNVLIRDRFTCQYCGKSLTLSTGTIDHLIPRSKGGPHSWDNVCAACKSCNNKKDNRLPRELEMRPKKRKYRAPNRAMLFAQYLRHPEYATWEPFFRELLSPQA